MGEIQKLTAPPARSYVNWIARLCFTVGAVQAVAANEVTGSGFSGFTLILRGSDNKLSILIFFGSATASQRHF